MRLLLALILLLPALSNAARGDLLVEVVDPLSSPRDPTNLKQLIYHLSFGVKITNKGTTTVYLGPGNVIIPSIENRDKNGSWKLLSQDSWFLSGTERYEPCLAIRPGDAFTIPRLSETLIISKSKLPTLGDPSKPVLRFQMIVFCRMDGEKNIHEEVLRTEPVAIPLVRQQPER